MGSELVVDLRTLPLATLDDFWDAVTAPCGLPDWFGRNLDAWWDTVETRGVSEVVDAHGLLVVRAREAGLFAPGHPDGVRLSSLFADATRARLDLEP
ncbi:barstar family protein [Streptomyces sp. NBC_01387]|uniref:barstar family protein n=1 Tax=unclassified Streptomyces TaxID=2593676 RepID=UPI002024A9FC|nr:MULTISPECIES: barstar family protein [unclassified Streptomyces]MCX4549735.1 barstar family protein [Streptomyces sp. NBC_01500]WSC21259.1 barstar family protein [Streptomyces sp. NBC_01766]WSV55195.1 barstar family protein [Streptomyces sp. NBC_01014]